MDGCVQLYVRACVHLCVRVCVRDHLRASACAYVRLRVLVVIMSVYMLCSLLLQNDTASKYMLRIARVNSF